MCVNGVLSCFIVFYRGTSDKKMSHIFNLLHQIENIREKIDEDEYTALIKTISEVHRDYYPELETVQCYPVTPREVVQQISLFLDGESRIQTDVAYHLQTISPLYTYKTYGFLTFKSWMEHIGFVVSLNRVFS